ncbi:MAG: hypothetical protein ACJA0X_001563 [Cyclobacteriaceae bacterium]|jgi:hypothetical protein
MKQDQLIGAENSTKQQNSLKGQIAQLKIELGDVSNKVDAFEALLRSQLTRELIETQELSVRYKAQKSEKKAKRLKQKSKGKKYVEPVGLKIQSQTRIATPTLSVDDLKEKKRLYREAMLNVHPDKFSMNDDKVDLATALTTRLVDIYKNEDLATLKAYHAHLFSNVDFTKNGTASVRKMELSISPDAYLIKEKAKLEKELKVIRKRHTYLVLTTYKDPSVFIGELRSYYQDRINKLKRRTRTKD